ncbi:MAG TPA: Fic family protein, partial [Usitatibacter sp.]|nr:Fic family protein [Usitatibacter sp.]
EFALRYEPLDLCVLGALFHEERAHVAMREALVRWLATTPSSQFARIAGHLFEWLTGTLLDYTLPAGAKRVPVLDEAAYFTGPAVRIAKWGVVHNLLGSRHMAPIVRRTPALAAVDARTLAARLGDIISSIDPGILHRALSYLYLAETQSSFAIEKEIPDHHRREAFRRLLEQAGSPGRFAEEVVVTWHRAIITQPLRQEMGYRTKQNWLSRGSSIHAAVDYVPPSPAHVHEMMEGVADLAQQGADSSVDPVIAAACSAFGFVFVHPFLDGNGRLHRFLLHHILRQAGVSPEGVVLPLSVALEANLADYGAVLQRYSSPRTRVLDYRLDPDTNTIHVRGEQPEWLYGFFDATEICELIWRCIERALSRDLPAELAWLRAYDSAMTRLGFWLDGAQAELDLLVRLVVQNHGRLSKNKRGHFDRFTDEEIAKAEAQIREAFIEWEEKFAT